MCVCVCAWIKMMADIEEKRKRRKHNWNKNKVKWLLKLIFNQFVCNVCVYVWVGGWIIGDSAKYNGNKDIERSDQSISS